MIYHSMTILKWKLWPILSRLSFSIIELSSFLIAVIGILLLIGAAAKWNVNMNKLMLRIRNELKHKQHLLKRSSNADCVASHINFTDLWAFTINNRKYLWPSDEPRLPPWDSSWMSRPFLTKGCISWVSCEWSFQVYRRKRQCRSQQSRHLAPSRSASSPYWAVWHLPW
jgi:hypothetical protein